MVFVLKTSVAPERLSDAVHDRGEHRPDLPVARLRAQEADRGLAAARALVRQAGGGARRLALALACIGLYRLMAYAVSRTPRIGIRMALGAARGRVLRMIVGDACRLMVIGLAIGLGAAVASGRYLENQLFGLTPSDPSTQALAIALLAMVSLPQPICPHAEPHASIR